MHGIGHIKKSLTIVEIGQRATLYQKVEMFAILGAARSHSVAPFTDWHEILLGQADPRAPWHCQISHELVQRVAPAWRKC